MAVLFIALLFISLILLAEWFNRPSFYKSNKSETYKTMTIEQIRKLNKANKARKEIEIERGKILAFKRKVWYRSTKRGVNDEQD